MLKFFIFFCVYFILARIGHLFNVESSHVALILPSSAIALIAMLEDRKIAIFSIFIGAFFAHALEFESIEGLFTIKAFFALFIIAGASIVEASLIKYFCWSSHKNLLFFYDDKTYLRFIGSAFLGTLIASFIGVQGPFLLGYITGEKLFSLLLRIGWGLFLELFFLLAI